MKVGDRVKVILDDDKLDRVFLSSQNFSAGTVGTILEHLVEEDREGYFVEENIKIFKVKMDVKIEPSNDEWDIPEDCLELIESKNTKEKASIDKQYVLVSRMGYKDYVGTLEEILEYASDNNVDILQERVFELGEEVKLKVVVEGVKSMQAPN